MNNLTTYEIGLLQSKAYRVLKSATSKCLVRYSLSTTEWAILGYIYKHKKMRSIEIAHLLGVEPPLVTQITNHLESLGYTKRTDDPSDRRAKIITLTEKGKRHVPTIEREVKSALKVLLGKLGVRDLLGYVRVLESINRLGSPDQTVN